MSNTPRDIADLPPSAKLVYLVLEYHGALTQQQLAEKTRLNQRTVRDGLRRLEGVGVVSSKPYPEDARKTLCELVLDDPRDGRAEAMD